MAAYPSYPQLIGSVIETIDDLKVDEAVNGSSKVRAYYPAVKGRFTLIHSLTVAERATHEAFYVTNRLLPVTLTWIKTGTVYTCLFAGPMQWQDIDKYRQFVTVNLREQ